MTASSRRAPGCFRLFAIAALLLGAAATPGACASDRDDRFVLLRRGAVRAPGAPTPLDYPADDDAGAARLRRLMSDPFAGELLRTFAMARRLAGDTAPPGSVRRARAQAPAYLALGVSDLYQQRPYRDRVIRSGWGQKRIAADVPLIWVDDEPTHLELGRTLARSGAAARGEGATDDEASDEALRDAVALDQIMRGLGNAILSLVQRTDDQIVGGERVPDPLVEGYLLFLEVVGAEWGGGPGGGRIGSAAGDARARLRHADWFAAVRGNQGVERSRRRRDDVPELADRGGSARRFADPTGDRLVRDPLVIATVLHRLAASSAGRRLAPDDTYRALVPELPPAGISPGRLLGSFRNFQAKLLVAWSRAGDAGRPPRDLVDLIEAYADAFPAERAEATRILLVTTFGLTARPGGVDADRSPDQVASELAALTADVLFGRIGLRAGLREQPRALD